MGLINYIGEAGATRLLTRLREKLSEYVKSDTLDAVQYNPQTLTNKQQTQARANIGAASAEVVDGLSKEIGDLKSAPGFVVDINGSGDYTSFAECLIHIRENKIYNANVYVKSGTYDIHREMIDLYGVNYWTDFTASTATRYNLGLPFGFGMKIRGDNGAELKCDCSGETNTAIESQFSILNAMYDTSRPYLGASISGIRLNCKKTRYCIHMEFSNAEAGGEYLVENCSMYMDNSMCSVWKHAACIGMGSGAYTTMTVVGCDCHPVFMANPTKKSAILWHNTGHDAPQNKVVIKDNFCDFDSTISIASKGGAITKTPAIVCNNSVDIALITLDSNQASPIFNTNNVNLMEWNNIIRNTPIEIYTITNTLTNCTGASDNATTITKGTPETLTFTANSGYVLPDSVVVIGATYSWNKASGTLVLSNPTSDVQITVIAEKFNLAVPNSTNTTDYTIWCNNARLGATGIAEQKDGYITTNYIPVKAGDTIRVKGIDCYRAAVYYNNDNTASPSGGCASVMANLNSTDYIESDFVDTAGDFRITLKPASTSTVMPNIAYFRISGTLTGNANDVIMTVNREIA
jgi:hypothetical protein